MQAMTLCTVALALTNPLAAQATRGVPPDAADKYPASPDGQWGCLSRADKLIPATNINDDFCDCADGSDEPGTAACSHFPDTTFWCENSKYIGNAIFSSRVNDGICDCCDGSDEYQSGLCTDRCVEIAAEANKAIIEKIGKVKRALAANKASREAAAAKRAQEQTELASLEQKLAEIMPGFTANEAQHTVFTAAETKRVEADRAVTTGLKKEMEAMLEPEKPANAEAPEGGVEAADVAVEEPVCDWEGKVKGIVDEQIEADYQDMNAWQKARITAVHPDGTVDVLYDDEEVEEKLGADRLRPILPDCGSSIADLDAHSTAKFDNTTCGHSSEVTCNEGYSGASAQYVCGADGKWKLPLDAGPAICALLPPKTPYVEKITAEDGSLKLQFEADVASESKFTFTAVPQTDPPGTALTATQEHVGEATLTGLTNDISYAITVEAINAAGSAKAAAASPVAPTAIKKTFQDKKSEKEAIDSQIATLKGKLAKDFGVDFKFASMDGNCFESDSGHFTYKFCGFDKVEQKDGASWNNLGAWGSWVDAVKKDVMKYEHGTRCWNGPERSTVVTLVCDDENKVIEVAEPETCAYTMTVGTPCMCTEADMPTLFGAEDLPAGVIPTKDEL